MNVLYLPIQKRPIPKENRLCGLDGFGTGWLIDTSLAIGIFAAFLSIWRMV